MALTLSHADTGIPRGVSVQGRDIQRAFDGRAVLDQLGLTISNGEFVALLGRSGSGKSTLLRILGGLDNGYEGDVWVPKKRAVVFQEARLVPWLKVLPNVTLGLPGESRGSLKNRGLAALDEVELTQQANAWPVTLSGGEAQRVALARALVREPRLLLLDEPFGALDALTRIRMHALLQALCARHRPAVLLVTHDVDEAVLLADRTLVLVDGRITLDLPIPLEHPRRRADPGFDELRSQLLAELGVEDD